MIKEICSLITFAMTLIHSLSSFKWQACVNSYKWPESFKKYIYLPHACSMNDMLALIFSHYLCHTMFLALHGIIKNKWNYWGFTFTWYRDCISISPCVCACVAFEVHPLTWWIIAIERVFIERGDTRPERENERKRKGWQSDKLGLCECINMFSMLFPSINDSK